MLNFTINDVKIVLRDIGEVIELFSLVLLIPVPLALYYGEGISAVEAYVTASVLGILTGLLLKRLFKNSGESRTVHAFTATTAVWILCPFIGALPYMFYLGSGPLDAYFESVSSMTTTGLTMLGFELPKSLIFWRSVEAWIGGAGIIVLALIGIFGFTKSARLSEAEGREERLRPNIIKSVRMVWLIYAFLTLLGVILLLGTGMPVFKAVNMSMQGISTTGLAPAEDILLYPGSKLCLMFITLMGSFSFLVHYKYMKGRLGAYLRDVQVKLILILALLAIILTIPQFTKMHGKTGLEDAAFSAVNAITNGGFQAFDYAPLGSFVVIITAVLMIIGGSTGSTSGGIKALRLWIFLKSAYWKTKEFILPSKAYFPRKIEGHNINDEDMNVTFLLIILYLVFLLFGSLTLVSTMPVNGEQAFFEVASAQGNAGLTMGITGPTMPPAAKVMLCLNMIVGRLEIIPLLIAGGFLLKIRRRD